LFLVFPSHTLQILVSINLRLSCTVNRGFLRWVAGGHQLLGAVLYVVAAAVVGAVRNSAALSARQPLRLP
jgi:hypothetical protein